MSIGPKPGKVAGKIIGKKVKKGHTVVIKGEPAKVFDRVRDKLKVKKVVKTHTNRIPYKKLFTIDVEEVKFPDGKPAY